MNEHEFAELAAGYALDALSPEELAAFETARAQHPEWERLVSTDAATAASLADGVPAAQPPAAVRDALLARISITPQAAPVAEPQVSRSEPVPDTAAVQTVARRTWTRALLGLAASLVLLVALGFGAVTIRDVLTEVPPAMAALELTMQADAYRTLQFKSRRAREWVVAFADPGSRRYVLAESMFGVTYWLPEELYRAVGGRPRP